MQKIRYGKGFGDVLTETDKDFPCLRSNGGGKMKGLGIIIPEATSKSKIKSIQFDVSGKGYKSQQDRIYQGGGDMCAIPNHRTESKLNIIVPEANIIQRPRGTNKGGIKENNCPAISTSAFEQNNLLNLKGKSIRRLTPTECMRLQGFSDDWCNIGIDKNGKDIKISDSQIYKMVGNAVSVPIVELVARKLKPYLENEK